MPYCMNVQPYLSFFFKYQDLVRKGIPNKLRGTVWQRLCNAHESSITEQYAEYIKATSACEKV